jgi:hypothetical protein
LKRAIKSTLCHRRIINCQRSGWVSDVADTDMLGKIVALL